MGTCKHPGQSCVQTLPIDWGLTVRAVDLTVANMGANVLVIWEYLNGATHGCNHTQVQPKRVHADTKGVVHIKLIYWHRLLICLK
jgi:hypothetical protein